MTGIEGGSEGVSSSSSAGCKARFTGDIRVSFIEGYLKGLKGSMGFNLQGYLKGSMGFLYRDTLRVLWVSYTGIFQGFKGDMLRVPFFGLLSGVLWLGKGYCLG